MSAATSKKCAQCQGRSFMNGFCLTCQHTQANRANRTNYASGDILTHVNASLDAGFVNKSAKAEVSA